MEKQPIRKFGIKDIGEFQRLRNANPQNPGLDSLQAALMYGRAIHWLSFLDVIWPAFDSLDYFKVEAAYIVVNDPDDAGLPVSFYHYIAQMIAMFWEIQLKQKYPAGDWSVEIDDDPEITVWAQIRSRG